MALPLEHCTERETEIIDEYLIVGSKSEINIPDSDRKLILSRKGKQYSDIFSDAQRYITHMLMRNVDNTWKFKHVVAVPKILKVGSELKREIDKVTDDPRISELIQYFLFHKITPMLYNLRTSVSSMKKKLKGQSSYWICSCIN